ncbi:MAG: response regulator transcription factor [Alphaproteobacteria bacterium]
MTTQTILCIDDDQTITQILEKTLNDHGYETITADNGEDGLALLEKSDVTAIILDIKMPGMNGNQVIGRIRTHNDKTIKNIPIMMLTGENSILDVSKSLELGANDYMVKPFEPQLIISRLQVLLN